MEEESGAQDAEAEQPPTVEEDNMAAESPPREVEEIEVMESVIMDDNGVTTRKIQTDFTLRPERQSVESAGAVPAPADASKGGPAKPSAAPFTPCGDMPLPPGADPGQWGFPEFCPKKMMRYAEAAASAAAAVLKNGTAHPGEAVDEPEAGLESVAEELVESNATGVVTLLSALSEVQTFQEGTEQLIESSSGNVYLDAIGEELREEWLSDGVPAIPDEAADEQVDTEVAMLSSAIAHTNSVEFQGPAATEEVEGTAEETAAEQQQEAEEEDALQHNYPQNSEQQQEAQEEDAMQHNYPQNSEQQQDVMQHSYPQKVAQQQEAREERAMHHNYPQKMDITDETAPVLWKIEQDIAVVRTRLNEMQQKITALDIADVLPVQRRKCVCDPQKKAAGRGLPALPALPAPTTGTPAFGRNEFVEDHDNFVYYSAPNLGHYNQPPSLGGVKHGLKSFPAPCGGVDIYIASRRGSTSAVTSISPANFQQHAEKPVLKAFTSPDVDVYVVTDNTTVPGYSGQS